MQTVSVAPEYSEQGMVPSGQLEVFGLTLWVCIKFGPPRFPHIVFPFKLVILRGSMPSLITPLQDSPGLYVKTDPFSISHKSKVPFQTR